LAWRVNFVVLEKAMPEILSALPYKEVLIPSLFIRGELSNYILDTDIKEIESFFLDMSIKTIKKAGHWVHADAPEEFTNTVLEFCLR
jgi:pimeloyl-ACP methyl ester carboxylesterase